MVFRLKKNRVFFCSLVASARALNFASKSIGSVGVCIGRLTRSSRLQFLVPAVGLLTRERGFGAVLANLGGEKEFIFGKPLGRGGILKISRALLKNDGVVVFGKNNLPVGFGEILRSHTMLHKAGAVGAVVVNHGDVGQYVRAV